VFEELFYKDLPVFGIWQDNGIPANGAALPLGKSSVTVILTDFFHTYTMEVHDDNVLSFMCEDGFDSIVWAVDDARKSCEVRSAILGR
jgi:hypothetical protein